MTSRPLGNSSVVNTVAVHNQRSFAMRELIAPAAPASFTQINFDFGQRPRFSWPKVAFASLYQVWRCQPSPWGGGGSCGTVSFSYFDFGSSMQVEDLLQTLGNSWPCNKPTRYYATAIDLVDGTSPPTNMQPIVCLQ